jgi:endopeptidase Clp ATP-binding regulatory subunit ClpX
MANEPKQPADNQPCTTQANEKKDLERKLGEYMAEKYGEKVEKVTPKVSSQAAPQLDDDDNGVWSKINFDMKPEELVSYLDQYIVRQDEAKAVLSTKICTHFNRARYLSARGGNDPADGVGLIKNNVLMIGPTGVGKTYMVKLIAAKLGVPFVKGDATKFSETGYVGGDVEDLVRELVHEAGDDLELAQYGIVYVDEVDKIASSPNLIGPDVSRTGVQRALLKPMEETEVDLKVPHDPISQIQAIEKYRKTGKRERRTLNTRHILFIMSGAFGELVDVIKRRLNTQCVGFAAEVSKPIEDQDYLKQATAADLVEFGFENEFVGRLPIHVVLEELAAEDLFQILKNPNNPVIVSKKRDFAAYDIELVFEEAALRVLAEQAAGMNTGARALVSVVEKALLPFEKHLPSTTVAHLLVTPELVNDPAGSLEALIADSAQGPDQERYRQAVRAERLDLMKMISLRESLYADRMELPLTTVMVDLIAEEYYRVGMSLGTAFESIISRLRDVEDLEFKFYENNGIRITFDPEAQAALINGAAAAGESVRKFWLPVARMLEDGLKLVQSRSGISQFLLPAESVTNTEVFINELLQRHYSGQSRTL